MKRASVALSLIIALAAAPLPAALPPVIGETALPTLAPMIKKVSPAVVNIATRGTIRERGQQNPLLDDPFFRRFFDVPPDTGPRERPFQSAGSGVIFDAKAGYILTNAHVVENATEITVTLQDGRDVKAEVLGSDAPSDVAVLKVKPEGLSQIALGDSAKVEVGDFVVAIGNPFGLQHTVTSGIISGLSRSGGNIGIGFAIPVNMARSVMEQLIKFGSVKRGQLGVSMYTVTPDIAHSLGLNNAVGALVSQVVEGSPAEKAGIRTGDVITSVNGQPVKSNSELRNSIGLRRVGDKVDIGLVRDGKPLKVTAVIADTATEAPGGAASIHESFEGATLSDAPEAGGALVRSVESGSAAAQAGLRAEDVIVGANRGRVGSVRELRERAKGAAVLVLEVRRGNTVLLVPLR